jgi:hypothetical protein
MTSDITGVATLSTDPIPSAQDKQQAPLGKLYLNASNGWITWQPYVPAHERNSRLCWLPIELRGDIFTSHEGVFAVSSRSTHQLTVIDFSPMLKSLYAKGFIL